MFVFMFAFSAITMALLCVPFELSYVLLRVVVPVLPRMVRSVRGHVLWSAAASLVRLSATPGVTASALLLSIMLGMLRLTVLSLSVLTLFRLVSVRMFLYIPVNVLLSPRVFASIPDAVRILLCLAMRFTPTSALLTLTFIAPAAPLLTILFSGPR